METLADRPVDVTVSPPELLAQGFRKYERHRAALAGIDGEPITQTRDVLRVGHVAGVLAVDLARDELVLIRQFRFQAHLAIRKGDFVEIVAGYVEPGEDAATAARREFIEEIGVVPGRLVELFGFMPAPGTSDEFGTLFLASVDASKVPERGGAADENEQVRPIRVKIDTALSALAQRTIHNGYLIIALQWLALNRARLATVLAEGTAGET
jgi:ADP-ribose diphosphatase